jgi:hypothetical protein
VNAAFGSIGAEIEAVHLRVPLCGKPCALPRWSINTSTRRLLEYPEAQPVGRPLRLHSAEAIDSLKILLAPFLPFTVPTAPRVFGYEDPIRRPVCAGGPRLVG